MRGHLGLGCQGREAWGLQGEPRANSQSQLLEKEHRHPDGHTALGHVCFAGINGKTLRNALGRHTPEPKSCHSNTAEPQPASLTLASIPNASPSWSRSSSQKSTTGTTSAHNSSGSSKISSVSVLSPQSPGELGWGSTGGHGQGQALPSFWPSPQCGGSALPNSLGFWQT